MYTHTLSGKIIIFNFTTFEVCNIVQLPSKVIYFTQIFKKRATNSSSGGRTKLFLSPSLHFSLFLFTSSSYPPLITSPLIFSLVMDDLFFFFFSFFPLSSPPRPPRPPRPPNVDIHRPPLILSTILVQS